MKIVKAIELTEDNIQQIWECPAVYRISKAQLDPINCIGDGNLGKDEPETSVFVQGFTLPCGANGGYLIQDEKGYWRYLKADEYAKLKQTDC